MRKSVQFMSTWTGVLYFLYVGLMAVVIKKIICTGKKQNQKQ